MAVYGYARDSDGYPAGQLDALQASGCDDLFWDVRASTQLGEGWSRLVDTVQAGDTVRVVEWSRITRSIETAEFIRSSLRELGVKVETLEPPKAHRE